MNRHREKSEVFSHGTTVNEGNWSGTWPDFVHVLRSVTTVMDDVVTPNFHQQLRSGKLILNPCTKVKTIVNKIGGGSLHSTYNANPVLYDDFSGSGSLTTVSSIIRPTAYPGLLALGGYSSVDAIKTAKLKAIAAIDKAPYTIAEDLAEIGETIRFIGNPIRGIYRLARKYRKDKVRLLARIRKRAKSTAYQTKALANLWLQYRFAFSPLVRSVQTVLESIEDQERTNYDKIHTAHGTSPYSSSILSDTKVKFQFTYERTSQVRSGKARAVVFYRVKPPLTEWRRKYGLRVKDLPELMWDLFPYSFMIDRVIDIGSSIRGLTNLVDPRIEILGGTVSTSHEAMQSISFTDFQTSGWTRTVVPDTDFFITEEYVRELWTPTSTDTIPPVMPKGLVSDITNVVDLLSITRQLLK